MGRKINAKNVSILALSTTTLSTAFGIIGSYALSRLYPHSNVDIGLNTALSWCLFHTPITLSAVDSLRQELGLKSPITIIGNSFNRGSRKIPFSAGGKDKHIFMSSIDIEAPQVDSITINMNDNNYTISIGDLEYFIRRGWARQRIGKAAFSRRYWKRNGLTTIEYSARMKTILAVEGVVVDRGERRTGKLALPPVEAMKAIITTLM